MANVLQKLSFLLPIEGFKRTLTRFPLSSLCSVALFIILILSVHDVLDLDDNLTAKVVFNLINGFFWFGVARLFAEARQWSFKHELLLALPVYLCLALISFSHYIDFFLFFMPALLISIIFAAFVSRNDDISLWVFNKTLWFGVAISIAAGILWAGGASAALGAVSYLFEVKIDGDIYADIWLFSMTVLVPLYSLSWVPEQLEYEEEECTAPPQLNFVLDWLAAPLVFVYFLILYAYFTKIAFTMELPNGHLSILIAGFSGAGIVTYLVGWPNREKGSFLLKSFYKFFFPVLVVPVGMLFFAIFERIHQYGVTEKRYIVALMGVWLAVITLLHFMKKLQLKHIPMVLAALLIAVSFGPWGAIDVSQDSQFKRLKATLIEHKILVDGKLNKVDGLSFETRKDISSKVEYLLDTDRREMMNEWLSKDLQNKDKIFATNIVQEMGFEFIGRYRSRNNDDSFYYLVKFNDGLEEYNLSDFEPYTALHFNNFGCYKSSVDCLNQYFGDAVKDLRIENDKLVYVTDFEKSGSYDFSSYLGHNVGQDNITEKQAKIIPIRSKKYIWGLIVEYINVHSNQGEKSVISIHFSGILKAPVELADE